ncbi:Ig-like domain-containing protein [Anaerocolumna aminovalerica]|jgi:hypothetical protein|uniref:Ig-like domain-containing protein n=1 Tax=Anaerocolumna aminovalerica TaxID=1527 RepID=UPI00293110B6|nr:Ig-like domain-containing protein [Anaerocolumna aminovalerica]
MAGELSLLVGNSKKITVKSAEGGKFVGEVTWTSSDKKVAIVDKSGNVTGIKQGSCH